MQKGFVHPLSLLLGVLLLILMGTIFYLSSFSKKTFTPPTQKKSTATQLPKDFGLPNFSKQELKSLSLDKSQVKTKRGIPTLEEIKDKSKVSLLGQVYAQDVGVMPVYKVVREIESTQSAVARATQFGFNETSLTKRDIRADYEYFLDWGVFPRDLPYYDEEADRKFREGAYDIFEISLVDDRTGRYLGAPYTRSYLGFHKTPLTETKGIEDEEAVDIALAFLKEKNLLPPGKLKAVVLTQENYGALGRYDTGNDRMVFIHRTIDELPVIDGGVSFKPEVTRLGVALKNDGVIGLSYEEFMTQIDYNTEFDAPVKSPQQALEELFKLNVLAGKVWFNEKLGPGFAFQGEIDWSQNKLKELTIENMSIAYYRNENITNEPAGNYYQPIYIFKASGIASGRDFRGDEEVNLEFYVSAVIAPSTPEAPKQESTQSAGVPTPAP